MTRLLAPLLLALLAAPTALAAGAADAPDPAAPLRAAGDAAAAVGAAATGAAAGAARAGASLAEGVGDAARAAADATLALVRALGHAVAALTATLGAALGAGGRLLAAHPKESAVAAGSLGGLATLYALARKWGALLLVPLYSRLAPSQMLDNAVRQRVYEHVKANPAAHPSAIAEALALGWGTVVYHLARLEESRLLTHRMSSNRKCYFAITGDLDVAGRDAVAALGTDKAKAIVAALRAEPSLSQKDLAQRLGISQALASWHVKRLVASGVLTTRREGRSNLLAVAAHVPAPA